MGATPEWPQVALNTDRELYREPKGDLPSDYYANSLHVTAQGHIGMNVGGTVVALPIEEWHRLAQVQQQPRRHPMTRLLDALARLVGWALERRITRFPRLTDDGEGKR
jgi:hypothetical protein